MALLMRRSTTTEPMASISSITYRRWCTGTVSLLLLVVEESSSPSRTSMCSFWNRRRSAAHEPTWDRRTLTTCRPVRLAMALMHDDLPLPCEPDIMMPRR